MKNVREDLAVGRGKQPDQPENRRCHKDDRPTAARGVSKNGAASYGPIAAVIIPMRMSWLPPAFEASSNQA